MVGGHYGSVGALTLNWQQAIMTYRITYNLDGGFTTQAACLPPTHTAPARRSPTPTRTGYTFAGWYTDALFAGLPVTTISATEDGAKTFWAKWTPVPSPTYTIATNPGAHGAISPVSPTVAEGADQTFSITPDTGYHVASLTADGSPIPPATSHTFINVTTTHTIAATFAPDTHVVTYDLGGGANPAGAPTSYTSTVWEPRFPHRRGVASPSPVGTPTRASPARRSPRSLPPTPAPRSSGPSGRRQRPPPTRSPR